MEPIIQAIENTDIAEVTTAVGKLISTGEDGTDLVGNLVYSGHHKAIIYQKDIAPDFFELRTGLAGEVLQKFSNYRVRVAIVGTFDGYNSKSLNDFIYESNKGKQVNFVATRADAIERLQQ